MPDQGGGPAPQKRRFPLGCGTGLGALAVLVGVVVLIVFGMFWRRGGDPVRLEVEIEGVALPTSGAVLATYRPEADIPFVTRDVMGGSPTIDVEATATARDGRLSVELEDGWPSIRDERLHYVSMHVGAGEVSFAPISDPQPFGAPELRTSGQVDPLEWAERAGDVATFRGHAHFLPSSIYYDAAAHTVRVVLDVTPINSARLSPDGTVEVQPGVSATARVTVARTGGGWPDTARRGALPAGSLVEAVVVSEDDLLSTLGWRTGFTPRIPVTRAEWAALAAHHDPRFALAVEPDESGATLRFAPPEGEPIGRSWHVVAVSFGPGDALASAAEAYLWPASNDGV
ncbi:MAG: hypothetical protein AB7S26_31830 [Sandaracinaceae bacterium]